MEWNFFFRRHLENGEYVLFVAHKHWIEIFPKAIKTAVFGFLVPWTAWFFFPAFFWGAVIWTILFWCWFFYHFADWYFDAWVATNMSLIDIEWRGIFHHLSSRIPYSEVREVSWEVNGFFGTILGFGDASVSMTTGGKVALHNIARPKRVELQILQIRDQFLSEQRMVESEALKGLLASMVASHVSEQRTSSL
ncbi:hypothetical protein IPN35_06515 [Candidatus Peregrinibacteria bacterium]|nr:MAG: hypothetical protein IPN35_06515 [Candidatus Peregrinibacteria bacterium]